MRSARRQLAVSAASGDREVILRVASAERAAETATEVAAMTCAARVAGGALPVAELLGYDLAERTGYGLVLIARVPGTSVIPAEPDPGRLRALRAPSRLGSARSSSPRHPRSRSGAGRSSARISRVCGASTARRICSARPRRRWPRPRPGRDGRARPGAWRGLVARQHTVG